jgi:hypothetical protein
VGPLVYRKVGGATHLSFVADSAGQILRYVSDDTSPIEVFERVPTLRTRAWLQWCLPAAALVLLFGLFASFGYARRWPRNGAIWIASRAGATCLLAAAIGWPTLMWKMAWNLPLRMSGAADPWLYALYATSVAGLCAIPIIALDGALALKRRNVGVAVAIDAALLCASAYLAWFVVSYHLASFSVRY